MSQGNLVTQGENVHLALSSTAGATTSVLLGIFDANLAPRALASFERLIIDDLQGNISTGTADILAAPAGTNAATSATLIASFNTAVGLDFTGKEGISLPVGVTPSVLPSSGTAVLRISGNGRIVEGTTQGVRPNWRESTNSRGL